jgi:hypothetical protein
MGSTDILPSREATVVRLSPAWWQPLGTEANSGGLGRGVRGRQLTVGVFESVHGGRTGLGA